MINGKRKVIRAHLKPGNAHRTPREKTNDALIGITSALILGVVVLLLSTHFFKGC
jgi:hypothetical protein